MFPSDMVQHQIHHQRDPILAQHRGKVLQVIHGPQIWPDCPIVGHRVAAIIGVGAWLEEGHHMQVTHSQLGEIVHFVGYPAQIPGKPICIADVADHLG